MGNESRRIEIEDYIFCIESRLRHLTDGGMVSINVKFLFACDIRRRSQVRLKLLLLV